MLKDIWFSDLIETSEFPSELLDELGKTLFDTLHKTSFDYSPTSEHILQDTTPRILFLSFNFDAESATVIIGSGLGILSALQHIHEQLLPYIHLKKMNIIKLDIATHVVSTGIKKLDSKWEMENSIHGIAFDKESGIAFLPEQIFSNSLVNQKKTLNHARVYTILTPYPLEAAHYKKLTLDKKSMTYTFKTKGLFIQKNIIQTIYRGKPYPNAITVENLQYRIKLAAHYLSNSFYSNGRLCYLFRPHRNSVSTDYNIVRHAGALYALFEYYEHFKDTSILPSATKGLDYLLKTLVPGRDPNTLCIAEKGEIKLGGTALACVALVQYITATGDNTKVSLLLKMGSHLLSTQQNNGQFKNQQYFCLNSVSTSNFESDYYPGETILAFLRIYKIDKNAQWLDAAKKGATWLITVRDKGVAELDLLHDHWLLYGLNELYKQNPQPVFLEHALKICNAILSKQILKASHPDWIGGFYKPPRSTPTATRGEGLSAAYQLVKNLEKYKDFSKKILSSYQKIIAFQYGIQYIPESSLYFLEPSRAIGGIPTSHTQAEIRIDFVQHAISSFTGYYKIITQEG